MQAMSTESKTIDQRLRVPRPLGATGWLGRWRRRQQLAALARLSPARLAALGERRALEAFRRAAARVPAYRDLLAEHGVAAADIRAIADLTARCPVLTTIV